MESVDVTADLTEVLLTEDQILARIAEIAREIDIDYEGREVLLVSRAHCAKWKSRWTGWRSPPTGRARSRAVWSAS
jgi:hypothetical protein